MLLVESDPLCREAMSVALRANGYSTSCAGNGEAALQFLSKQTFDLLLLDGAMPAPGGMRLLWEVRNQPALETLPVILMLGAPKPELVRQAAWCKVSSCVLRTCDTSWTEIVKRIERALPHIPGEDCSDRQEPRSRRIALPPEVSVETAGEARTAEPERQFDRVMQRPRGLAAVAVSSPMGSPMVRKVSDVDDIVPIIGRREMVDLIDKGIELRPLGPTVQTVVSQCRNPECTLDDLTKSISNDQAMCVKLIRASNCVAYTRGRQVVNLENAIQRLGVQQVGRLVMTMGIIEQYEGAVSMHIDTRQFWEHSLACGLASTYLARKLNLENNEEYFLLGVIHDFGRAILLELLPDHYAQVMEVSENLGLPLELIEKRMLGMNHCQVLERALKQWKFPTELIQPAVKHHTPLQGIRKLGRDTVQSALVTSVANKLSHWMLEGDSGDRFLEPVNQFLTALGLGRADIEELPDWIGGQLQETKCALLSRSADTTWATFLQRVSDQIEADIQPVVFPRRDEEFGINWFFGRVCTGQDKPNLAIMVMKRRTGVEAYLKELLAYEQEESLPLLPVLLLGDFEESMLDVLQGRRFHYLGLPINIHALLAAAAALVGAPARLAHAPMPERSPVPTPV